ncbi:GNAT family N-acetyltransferase [Iodobacter sp. CM08]|uniref:GNAT family N-acetyltransferase n=1 Tax=Iodobacter sp. CM08 TaxID=3085902 RepID=UPI002981563A|nr:GNAT family N-acetyltransferase [Iodobacter sp. CM08]MDW5418840.1 GNAT family N-acetyltransferase [Iodobacter sp. CM08]
MLRIRQVSPHETPLLAGLVALLQEGVQHGASIGFLAPLSASVALAYWQNVLQSQGLVLWVAEQEGKVIGTAQLDLCGKENGQHRAEVQKLIVLKECRGQGIASQLMQHIEQFARSQGRHLLILDTQTGSAAEMLYQKLGWQRAGEIPNFALNPAGRLFPTSLYFKLITHP